MNSNSSSSFQIKPGGVISGRIIVPGDKSISHRALMLGAIAEGNTTITGFLQGEDTLATANVLRQMGVEIKNDGKIVCIKGVGLKGLKKTNSPIDLGNSGTSVRLMTGLLAGQIFDSELIGDKSLMTRPMLRVINPLRSMNAEISCTDKGTLPINIIGGCKLQGIEYELPVASAQLKSCLLLAGLYAEGITTIIEKQATRDHTERMLSAFSHSITRDEKRISISKADSLIGTDINIPADFLQRRFLL